MYNEHIYQISVHTTQWISITTILFILTSHLHLTVHSLRIAG